MYICKSCTDFNYDVFSEMLNLIKVKSLALTYRLQKLQGNSKLNYSTKRQVVGNWSGLASFKEQNGKKSAMMV